MSKVKHQYFCTKCSTERDGLLDHPVIGIGGYSWNCPRCNGPVDSREVVMSEEMFIGDYAPKRIWVDEHSEWWPTHSRSDTTPYIRADIVDELVEALKGVIENSYTQIIQYEDLLRARAALAKLEESHE